MQKYIANLVLIKLGQKNTLFDNKLRANGI